jgi:hypothetical protein
MAKPKTRPSPAAGILVLLPFVCLAGYIVGAWGAKDELAAYKRSMSAEKKNFAGKMSGFDTFAGMVKIPEVTRRPRRAKPEKVLAEDVSGKNAAGAASAQGAAPSADGASARSPAARRRPVEDLGARIEEAEELWRTRVEIARSQWKKKLNLSGDGERAFDSALEEMNDRLLESISTVAEMIAESDSFSPELGLRLVGETTAIMAETYDRIGESVPVDMRGEVSRIQMVDFVDPSVASPLVKVQGRLRDLQVRPER